MVVQGKENKVDLKSGLPKRVIVKSVTSGRYEPGSKPTFFEERKPALEIVQTEEGEELKIYSLGSQSTPAPGWELLLNEELEFEGTPCFGWTLYGLS